jgi:excisionase family DNA binding protein
MTAEPDGAAPEAVRFEPVSVRIREACRLTGIGRSKFYELVASGDVEVVKIGAMTLVPFDSLRSLIAGRRGARGRALGNQEDVR